MERRRKRRKSQRERGRRETKFVRKVRTRSPIWVKSQGAYRVSDSEVNEEKKLSTNLEVGPDCEEKRRRKGKAKSASALSLLSKSNEGQGEDEILTMTPVVGLSSIFTDKLQGVSLHGLLEIRPRRDELPVLLSKKLRVSQELPRVPLWKRDSRGEKDTDLVASQSEGIVSMYSKSERTNP